MGNDFEGDKFDHSALSWFESAYNEQRRFREVYTQDFQDMLAVDTDVAQNKQNPLDLLQDPSDLKRGWKDKTNFGAIKLKAKASAIKAHILEAYKQGRKMPASLAGTPVEDLEEQVIRQYPGGAVPSEVLQRARELARDGLRKAERYLLDQLVEADFDGETLEEMIDLFVNFGSVAIESPIESVDRRLDHQMVPIMDANGQPIGFETNPTYVKKTVLRTKVRAPWEVCLDTEANGDPQAGRGLAVIDYLATAQLKAMRGDPAIDQSALEEVISKTEEESDGHDDSGHRSTKHERYMGIQGQNTKPHEMLSIYFDISRSELLEMKQGDLVDEMDKDDYYTGADPTYRVLAIYLNRKRVYLKPLHTVTKTRPIHYTGMVHLRGTNFFYGMYSLGRPATLAMNKLWRRAVDNEILSGSTIIAYDKDVVDPQTAIFEPGALWELDTAAASAKGYSRPQDAVFQIHFNCVAGGLMELNTTMDALMDEITMSPKNLSGITESVEQTATEVSTNLSSAQTIILGWLKRMDKRLMAPMIQGFYDHMLMNDMLPSDAMVSAKVRVFGADTFANQVINKRMVMELFQMLPNFVQTMPGAVDKLNMEKVILQYIESLGYEREDVVRDEAGFNMITSLREQNAQLQQGMEQLQEGLKQAEGTNNQLEQQMTQVRMKNHELQLENRSVKESARSEGQRLKADLQRMVEVEKAKRNKELGLVTGGGDA